MDRYREANRRLWAEWTRVHEQSDFYNLESFKAGTTRHRPFDAAPGVRIRSYEVEDVGDVRDKDLLHLQCHFGIDTLSWARLGARVTGIDFSEPAIDLARSLAREMAIDAHFVVSPVEELPASLDGDFDIVYTSRGAIWWLSDLERWAEVIAHFLRPGGVFYITEFHPVLMTFDEADTSEPRIRYPYFPRREPLEFSVQGSYADPSAHVETDVEYGWTHSMGEIVTAIARAGLRIEFLNELDWVDYQQIPLLEKGADARWRLPATVPGEVPLMFSLRARKPQVDTVKRSERGDTMSEVAERLAKIQERVDVALDAAKNDGGASPVLQAVVQEFAKKFAKARKAIDDGGSEREAVVEAEQAADSAKYAAEADTGLEETTREAIVAAHDRVCVLKNKMDAG